MKKVIIVEDIVQVTLDIKSNLSSFEVKIFNNAKSFVQLMHDNEFKSFLQQTDFFILDFNLGDASLVSSNIYEFILKHRKPESILCCISSFGQHIVDKNCEVIANEFNLKQPFHAYLRKNPDLISSFVTNHE